MRTIRYKRASLISNAMGCLAVAAVGAWAAFTFEAAWMVVGAFLAVGLPVVAAALIIKANGDCDAIKFDQHGLAVSTLWSTKTMSWPEVVKIQRETVQQSQFFGLYKRDISNYLVITPIDGATFGNLKINEHLLDIPRESIPSLIEEMGRAATGGSTTLNRPAQSSPHAGTRAPGTSPQLPQRAGVGPKGFGKRASG